MGCAFWNFLLIASGYIVGIFSYSLEEFFIVFAGLSLAIIIFGSCWGCYYLIKHQGRRLAISSDSSILCYFAFIPFIILIFTLLVTHSTSVEFDAIFLYLTSAKSMVVTNSLHYGFFRQTGLTTTVSPATPITYAWLMVLCHSTSDFEVAVRIIPFAFILLTSILVYLMVKEISDDHIIPIIGSVFFLSIPVVAAVASNYSLYLDIPFTFLLFLNVFIMTRIFSRARSKQEPSNFWWFMLGVALSFMLLEKDMSFFILPALLAIILIPTFQRFKQKSQVVLAFVLALLFTGGYDFFFVWDIYHSSAGTMSSIIIKQIPIFVIIPVVSLLFYLNSDNSAVTKRSLTYFCIPLVPVVLYLVRNILLYGAISYDLPFFNTDWNKALTIMNNAGISKILPTNLFANLRWDILLTSFNLGAVFVIPIVLGLSVTVRSFLSKRVEGKIGFIVLLFIIALVGVWSWALNCEYQGSALRGLYYFAPFFATFAAIGLQTVVNKTHAGKSLAPRFIVFISLVFLYLWAVRFNINGSDTDQIGNWLTSVKIADLETFLASAFFFFLCFFPFGLITQRANFEQHTKVLRNFRLIIPVALLALAISLTLPFSASMLSNYQEEISHISPSWENNLNEVISYINQNLKNNFTIITCYAMPIAYFTSHPIIEATTYDGIITLLSLNSTPTVNALREQNVHYLLYPRPGNNYYSYFQNLSKEIPILGNDFTYGNPNIVLIKEFSKYTLYNVTTTNEMKYIYSYLTTFNNDSSPLNYQSQMSYNSRGVTLNSTQYNIEYIADSYQSTFWKPAKANDQDQINISDDSQNKILGNDSLRIDLNGTGNMVLAHTYTTPQNWSSYNTIALYFYGANTTKTITVTFHTKSWQDYFYEYFVDDFTGWKKISIPIYSFSTYGTPSWTNITYIEILMGDRKTTYYMGPISLEGLNVGFTGSLPSIATNSSEAEIVVSTQGYNLSCPAKITLTSASGELTSTLQDGVNSITIPSQFLSEGTTFDIYYAQSNGEETLAVYYLGILSH
ncbi:MAG TPA: glycosyltransferase family 39 protein [Candidatus Bathyarchaeia archaeon]|nr:glycosyltransferase family 39 protein [Candidatus Bathyarchaeia archaeon]